MERGRNSEADSKKNINPESSNEEQMAEEDEKVPNLYRGEALNSEELYELGANKLLNLVYVTGNVESGKTTLLTMMYYLFVSGKTKNLEFVGSRTLLGYNKRISEYLITSGNANPQTERTSIDSKDIFLHLSLACSMKNQKTQEKKRCNLIFTDLSGELDENSFAGDENYYPVLQKLYNIKNVIITIDGEKLYGRKRFATQTEGFDRFTKLCSRKIIGKKTTVHMVITKYDKVKNRMGNTLVMNQVEKYKANFIRRMKDQCDSIEFYDIASITQHAEVKNFYGLEYLLEKIFENCMDDNRKNRDWVSNSVAIYADRMYAHRSFDKFAWKV